jgi:hypothetical protein
MTTKIDGTLGITFPDGSVQNTAALSIGVSQTWQNMIASRALNATYTNTTGKPIMVAVQGNFAVNQYFELVIGGVSVAISGWNSFASGSVNGTVTGIVPNGTSYIVNSTGVSGGLKWAELR